MSSTKTLSNRVTVCKTFSILFQLFIINYYSKLCEKLYNQLLHNIPIHHTEKTNNKYIYYYKVEQEDKEKKNTYRNDKVVNGLYDLWLFISDIGVPQKSLRNTFVIGLIPITSLFIVIAGMSSCTKSPCIPFA
jgi:hypothetical protein